MRAPAAERAVGEALDRLEDAGWHTVHSIVLPGADRIHHLAIGPAGVFCVRALWARKQRVRVAGPVVTVGRRAPLPLLRVLRALTDRASYALTTGVRPVLAAVDPSAVDVLAPLREARVLPHTELTGLAGLGGVLKPADVEALHSMARDRNTWARV